MKETLIFLFGQVGIFYGHPSLLPLIYNYRLIYKVKSKKLKIF
jgi:hypothetical protein